MLDFAEGMAWAGEAWIRLGAPFDGAGFPSAGTIGHEIVCNPGKEIGAEAEAHGFRTGLKESLGVAPGSRQGSGKAQASQRKDGIDGPPVASGGG